MPPTNYAFSQSSGPTSAYARHLQAASAYLSYYGGSVPVPAKCRSERDILEAHHQFIRSSDDDPDDKEKRLAKSYYEKLFKEFAVVELARWRDKQIAMRWRTKHEVLNGKGQFTCANLSCRNQRSTLDEGAGEKEGEGEGRLRSFELNFEYVEYGEEKNALVTTRVCEECADKLRYVQRGEGRRKRRGSRSRSRSRSRHRSRNDGGRRRERNRSTGRKEKRRFESPEKGSVGGRRCRSRD